MAYCGGTFVGESLFSRYMFPYPPSWLQQWSEIIAGLGTVVLTVFLVLLYKRQARQLEAQHEAVLEVTNAEWYGDKAIIWISNFGNGVAKSLNLATLVKSDTGEHCEHIVRSNSLKRIDKEGEWTNLIQPGEEEVPFHGTSKVGKLAPRNWSGDWISIKFSNFIRIARDNDSTEVKYAHVVQGAELSGNSCWDRIDPMTQSVNPQDFDREHSLGNLPGKTKHGLDNTFYRYFRTSIFWKLAVRLYVFSIRILNKVIPKVKLRPRSLDASGTKRVKRIILKKDIKDFYGNLKSKVSSGRTWLGNRLPIKGA
jgi:hypothetical protein